MNKKTLFATVVLASSLFMSRAQAQVQDVSIIVSPYGAYNWWNENIAFKNTPMYGVRAGFGFGPFFEVRGNIERTVNLKNSFESKSWNPFKNNPELLDKIGGMNQTITRFGGEVKVNLLNGYVVAPYVAAGAGVQVLDYNPFDSKSLQDAKETVKTKEKQLYFAAAAGLKFNLSDRIALSLEGRNVRFNLDPNNSFVNSTLTDNKKWGNWQAVASLDFYLGANTTAKGAYARNFRNLYSDGFNGLKFVLEPGVNYVKWGKNSDYTGSQLFVGGSAGIDFNTFVGIRGYYYQGTLPASPKNLKDIKFNNSLRMYGGNFITRLNVPRGIVPYLQFGAGFIDDNNYSDPADQKLYKLHRTFIQLGAGIEVPVSRWISIFGNANTLLMAKPGTFKQENGELSFPSKPSDIMSNLMYGAGIRFNIGLPSANDGGLDNLFAAQNERLNKEIAMLREERKNLEAMGFDSDYDGVISKSEAKRIEKLATEEAKLEARIKEIERKEAELKEKANRTRSNTTIKGAQMMTKGEFEDMVERVLEDVRSEENRRASIYTSDDTQLLLSALNRGQNGGVCCAKGHNATPMQSNNLVAPSVVPATPVAPATTIIVPNANGTMQSSTINSQGQVVAPEAIYPQTMDVYESGKVVRRNTGLRLNRIAPVFGVNFGESTQALVGIRGYLQIANTSLDFVPEAQIGFGKTTGFNVGANVLYNIQLDGVIVDPYVGLGLGIYNHGTGVKFGPNIILGTTFKLFDRGELFADYVSRGLFKNNQVSAGYRFVF